MFEICLKLLLFEICLKLEIFKKFTKNINII